MKPDQNHSFEMHDATSGAARAEGLSQSRGVHHMLAIRLQMTYRYDEAVSEVKSLRGSHGRLLPIPPRAVCRYQNCPTAP